MEECDQSFTQIEGVFYLVSLDENPSLLVEGPVLYPTKSPWLPSLKVAYIEAENIHKMSVEKYVWREKMF